MILRCETNDLHTPDEWIDNGHDEDTNIWDILGTSPDCDRFTRTEISTYNHWGLTRHTEPENQYQCEEHPHAIVHVFNNDTDYEPWIDQLRDLGWIICDDCREIEPDDPTYCYAFTNLDTYNNHRIDDHGADDPDLDWHEVALTRPHPEHHDITGIVNGQPTLLRWNGTRYRPVPRTLQGAFTQEHDT